MKHLLHIAFVLFTIVQISAQQLTISGVVTSSSDGLPLPGVNVIIKGTKTGTQTNLDGLYTITAKTGDVLNFTFLGMKSKDVTVDKSTTINVNLEEDSLALEEIVVVGYGSRSKESFTASSSKVKIRGASSMSAESKLSGKVSGLGIKSYEPQSGQLTAGEINDIEKWDEWMKAKKSNDINEVQNWGFHLENKVEVLVVDEFNLPLSNIKVALFDDNNTLIMNMLTDVFGKSVLFKDITAACKSEFYTIQVYQNGKIYGKKITNHKTATFKLESSRLQNNVDIMFTIDATGSMGDEINYLKSELKDIMSRLDKKIERKRVALTVYRDRGDDYVVRDFDFETNIDIVKENLSQQSANGGGDYEEAVEEALRVAMSKSWNEDSKTKLMFLLLDAPPHFTQENVETIKNQIKIAQDKGIRIIPIVASGANKNVEFLMRYFSISTNGTYVFLTDDSGIGNPHIKPTTDDYKVEKLNDLIVRLIEKYSGVIS